jgi:acyl carrier protein
VKAAACDVADERALRALLADVRASMPPIAGIMHAAMVLDDALLTNLTAEQLTSVLTPKVQGADNLDRLTREDPLDYFVLFSSITTLVGNPGQAAYVAANGYLEGLARLRREEGRPALAIAWGAIADVGILAREKGLAESLARRVGVKAMPARDALDLMAQALGRAETDAVMAIGSLDWSAARRLPALSSPTFAALTREGSVVDAAERKTIDLRVLLATTENDKVRKQVSEIIVEEIASVLRVPKEDVSLTKKLAEIGLDSLMAIELAGALQERFELSATPSGSVGTLSVFGLAEHIMASASGGSPDEEARVTQALNERHAGVNLDAQTLAPLAEAMTHKSRELKGLLQ